MSTVPGSRPARAEGTRGTVAHRPLPLERGDVGGAGGGDLGGEIVLAGVGLEVLELELQLVEQAAGALGAGTVLLTPELGDLQLR